MLPETHLAKKCQFLETTHTAINHKDLQGKVKGNIFLTKPKCETNRGFIRTYFLVCLFFKKVSLKTSGGNKKKKLTR